MIKTLCRPLIPLAYDALKAYWANPSRAKSSNFLTDKNASCSTFKETHFEFGLSNLPDLVKMKAFVDKTALIKDIFKTSPMNLITAPRRFGKTANMNTIKAFIEIHVDDNGAIIEKEDSSNYRIFKDNHLLIFQDKDFFDEHFATYPVIHADFKHVFAKSYDEILNKFRTVLNEIYKGHRYLLESKIWSKRGLNINYFKKYFDNVESKTLDEEEIIIGLKFLSKCFFYHFDKKKVFVLIDEYDAPINNALFEKEININDISCSVKFSQILLKGITL